MALNRVLPLGQSYNGPAYVLLWAAGSVVAETELRWGYCARCKRHVEFPHDCPEPEEKKAAA